MKMKDLTKTNAFKRRNSCWPAEKWDYTEWEECLEEAKKELDKLAIMCYNK